MNPLTRALSWKLSLVLSLLLLVPRAGLAQEEVTPEAEPFVRTELPRSVHLVEGLAEERATTRETSPMVRGLVVATGAVLTGALGGGLGFLFAQATAPSGGDADLFRALVSVTTGVFLGIPLGAWGGGALADGRGSFLAALGGSVIGVGVGVATLIAIASATNPNDDNALTMAGFVGLPLTAILGAVLGYELSHAWNTPAGLQPTVSVSSGGAALGLSGSF